MAKEKKVRVRFAPSPTGHLHIGGARTALFNFLFVRGIGGTFILRIEDTDKERETKDAVNHIKDGLKWLKLDWDEGPDVGGDFGPYTQLERLDIYKKQAKKLVDEDKAYYCYCSPEELSERRKESMKRGLPPKYNQKCRRLSDDEKKAMDKEGKPVVIRFATPTTGETVFKDLIKGGVKFINKVLDDFVILKSNDIPTYNFAAVIDDHDMQISHVIRGDDHISNTPRQILLFKALGFDNIPLFAHLPMILGSDGSRLSKRHGATSVVDYEQQGYDPDALVNYLALLGWSSGTEQEIFSLKELVKKFSLERVGTSAAVFDPEKLEWMNGEYLRDEDVNTLTEGITHYIQVNTQVKSLAGSWYEKDPSYFKQAVQLLQERIKTYQDFIDQGKFFFEDLKDDDFDEKAWKKIMTKPQVVPVLEQLKERIPKMDEFTADALEKMMRELAEEMELGTGNVFHPLRVSISGKMVGPSLFHMAEVLGKDRVLDRINKALTRLSR